jgi:hypothetical protein
MSVEISFTALVASRQVALRWVWYSILLPSELKIAGLPWVNSLAPLALTRRRKNTIAESNHGELNYSTSYLKALYCLLILSLMH